MSRRRPSDRARRARGMPARGRGARRSRSTRAHLAGPPRGPRRMLLGEGGIVRSDRADLVNLAVTGGFPEIGDEEGVGRREEAVQVDEVGLEVPDEVEVLARGPVVEDQGVLLV